MVTVEVFSRLISGVYRSAASPENWVPALNDVRRAVGATGGGLAIGDGAGRRVVNANVAPEAMDVYSQYYRHIDYVLATLEAGPVGLVRSGSELVAVNANSEFDADWMRPYQMDDGLFVKLTDGAIPTCLILAAPKRSESFDTFERVKLVDALVPHLQQALRAQQHIQDLVDDRDQLSHAVDFLRHGIVVLGPNRSAVHVNSAAGRILRSNDGLQLCSGSVEATRAAVNTELRRSIDRAFTQGGLDVWGGSFLCPRPSGLRPYIVHVLPIDQNIDTPPQSRRAIIALIDPELAFESPLSLLQRLCGLTAAEADVAVRIARGAEPKEISDQLSVSITTVRKHLQHVYDKTDTHRQAELVRFVLTLRP